MFLKSNDADLFVTSFGSGSRTIVAHGGWVGSGELWQLPFESLSHRWRAVTFDHRGTGATLNRAVTITFEMLVNDLFRVLDALEIKTCVLAGESAGACVILEAALRQPNRFSGLVVVDGRYEGTKNEGRTRLIEGCKADFAATMEAFVNACTPDEHCEAERRWGKQIVMRSNGPVAVQLLECLEVVRLKDRLSEIQQPTLVIHGDRDVIAPIADSQYLAQELPYAKLVTLAGAGHVPTVTRPIDVVRAIEEFFATNTP
ncbi:MAG TPA: alpha/beta hydrolase [Burkholderiales bacterium]|nr:alpha/beta hydrolase [Burkholderiales bacterium]